MRELNIKQNVPPLSEIADRNPFKGPKFDEQLGELRALAGSKIRDAQKALMSHVEGESLRKTKGNAEPEDRNDELEKKVAALSIEFDDAQRSIYMLWLAFSLNPASSYICYRAAVIVAKTQANLDLALQFALRAHELDKTNALYMHVVGLTYAKMKDFESAEMWLQRSLEINPEGLLPLNALTTVLIQEGKLLGAEIMARRGLKIAERNTSPYAASFRSLIARVAAIREAEK